MHSAWRNREEWANEGLEFSTASDEACKLYDAGLTQYIQWREEVGQNNIEGCLTRMLEHDSNFVMGKVLGLGLDLVGTGRSFRVDKSFEKEISDLVNLANSSELNSREARHVSAIRLWADGYNPEACDVWEDVLVDHPTDLLALKFAHDNYFYLGLQREMRDSIARVLPFWKPHMPLYGYLMGMHSFGLVETNLFAEAEKVAQKGLEINKHDAWSTHSMAHVLEMMGRHEEGVKFMSSTESDWEICGMLACHNYWHWAVYNIERGAKEEALGIYDTQIGKRVQSGAMLDIVDGCSALYRLEMEGVNVGDRWNDVYEICRPHLGDQVMVFNDLHFLMSCLGSCHRQEANKLLDNMREIVKTGKGENHRLTEKVGVAMAEAFCAYDDGDYGRAVDLVYPLRYDIMGIGGSNAQRDVFNQFLIHAALQSSSPSHHRIARVLLAERKSLRENSPLTDRLMQNAVLQHSS